MNTSRGFLTHIRKEHESCTFSPEFVESIESGRLQDQKGNQTLKKKTSKLRGNYFKILISVEEKCSLRFYLNFPIHRLSALPYEFERNENFRTIQRKLIFQSI